MIHREPSKPCLFVLDTNVLMHDPTAIFRFQEHDIFLPMVVLEELDAAKKGMSEVSRNVRQVSRFLDQLMQGADKDEIDAGLPVSPPVERTPAGGYSPPPGGCTSRPSTCARVSPEALPGTNADNNLLGTAQALRELRPDRTVVIVSKDINLRIKAAVLGIPAEDYSNDQVLDDAALLYTGMAALPETFWDTHEKGIDSWKEEGRTYYRVTGPDIAEWYTEPVHLSGGRRQLRGHGAREAIPHRGRDRAGHRLSPEPPQHLGHHRPQPRAELCSQHAARPGHRLRHPAWGPPGPARPCSPWPRGSPRSSTAISTARSS